jgi:hypothetical protein
VDDSTAVPPHTDLEMIIVRHSVYRVVMITAGSKQLVDQ